ISAKDARDNPVPSVEGIIQGRAAGVNITQSSGIPGQAQSIRIRGTTSITATNEPLYVVDGVPMVSESNSQLFTGGYNSNSMADLNPADIETISVLKDAAATAIYGSRGANGVILITTKRGKAGKSKINFNYYSGVQQPTRVIEMLDSRQFIEMLDEAAANDGFVEGYWSGNGPGFNFIGDPNDPELQNTDWLDEIYQNGNISNYDLSAAGGNETVQYYVGGSYLQNEGYFRGSSFDRISGRVNLDVLATDKLKFGTNMLLSRTRQNRPIGDNSLFGGPINALAGDPTMPVFEDDGSYADPFVYWSWWAFENPRAATDIYQRQSFTNRVLATVFADYEFFPGLTFRSSWSIDYKTLNDKSFIPSNAAQSFRNDIGGQGFFGTNEDFTYNIENYLTYTKDFGDHSLTATAIYSLQESNSQFSSINGQTYALDALPNLALASEITAGSQNGTSWGIRSLTGRINYGYKGKYFFDFTTRYDGSSRFGSQTRNGTFPAASVAWRAIEEPFLQDVSFLSDLKLRASYGVTGNQEGINNFASRALWTTQAAYNNQGSALPNRLGNGDLQWERTASLDIGIDIGLFADRVTISADYYNKQTNELLL
ncbi:MAG: SusC/RagA family TonB-linked outer membrane protein, partial [Bacteroidota bacterium]